MSDSPLIFDSQALATVRSRIPETSSPFIQDENGDYYRFADSVYVYLQKLIACNRVPKNGYVFFAFAPSELVRSIESHGRPFPHIRKQTKEDITAKLIMCLDTTLVSSRIFECNKGSDEAWAGLCEQLEVVENLCNEPLCHVIVDFSNNKLMLHIPDGKGSTWEQIVDFTPNNKKFSKVDLETFADEFHENQTKLPYGMLGVWHNQGKYKLISNTEDRITNHFMWLLHREIGRENAFREARSVHGNTDLFIHPNALAEGVGPCVMEFKVLRESSRSKSEEHLQEGILQAVDYGKDREANSLYLMAYDGRKELGRVDTVDAEAEKQGVCYMHYKMYNTTPGERKAKLANRKKVKNRTGKSKKSAG